MPSFKHKTNKKILLNENSIVTIDSKHKEINQNFNDIKNNHLPELRSKKKKLNLLLENDKIQLDKKAQIKDEINEINKELKKSKKDKKEYYLNNSKYIFDYFEDKKNISSDNNSKSKILNSFFKINDEEKTNNTENENQNSKEKIIKNYLSNIDESFININDYVVNNENCKFCLQAELIPIEHEGLLVCNKCFNNVSSLIENEKPSYKEPPKEACFYAYKRINHFREILAQFQAKETTQIPEEVLENIKLQIKKERITLDSFTNKKAKDVLKKLGYNKYYEHIPFIKDKLGIKPPVMSPELEDKLCNLFMEIQKPYSSHCPDDRVNFLNYYYVLYKMCELLDEKDFLPFFPMLKDPIKRIEQDEIWKKICKELNWEFIPTI